MVCDCAIHAHLNTTIQRCNTATQVVYLHAHIKPGQRDGFLACSIRNLLTNIGPLTPLHIYIFTFDPMVETLEKQLSNALTTEHRARVCVLRIPREQWTYSPRRREYRAPANRNRFGSYLGERFVSGTLINRV